VWVASRRPAASRGCRAGARERLHSQGLDNGVSSLTPRAVWFVGLCHICRRCSSSDRDTGETPVQRHTGSRGPVASQSIRRSTSTFSGLLSWGSSIAPPSTQPSLRRHPPGPSPRLRLGTARSRACSALAVPPGFSGFLRSEQIRRSARSTVRGFVAPRSRPWGSPSFGLPGSASQPNRRPEGRGPEGPGESSPVAVTLRSVLLLGSRRPCRHRVSSFRTRSRSPAGVPSRRWSRARSRVATPRCAALDLRAFFHRGVRCVRATLPSRDRSMLPWALDRLVSDAAARIAPPSSRWTFRLAARTALASPDPNVGGRQGVSALSGSMRPTSGCPRRDDRSRSRLAPAPPEGDTSAALHNGPRSGMPVDPPREEVHRVGPTPEGVRLPTSSRRISEETRTRPSARSEERRPVVRAPSLRPSAVARVHEERPLAADTHTRRCARLRATRAHPRLREGSVLRRTRHPSPEGLERWANRRHHPEVGPWRLVAPASPASWRCRLRARQSSCSPGRPRLDPKTKSLPRSEDRIDRRRSAVGAVGPHIPPVVAIRREHRSARAEMDRDPSRAAPTGVGAASVPESPKRSRNPDRCDPDGQ
jgi:hypothetical protein